MFRGYSDWKSDFHSQLEELGHLGPVFTQGSVFPRAMMVSLGTQDLGVSCLCVVCGLHMQLGHWIERYWRHKVAP